LFLLLFKTKVLSLKQKLKILDLSLENFRFQGKMGFEIWPSDLSVLMILDLTVRFHLGFAHHCCGHTSCQLPAKILITNVYISSLKSQVYTI